MDDPTTPPDATASLDALEVALRALAPRAPSPDLMARLATSLDVPAREARRAPARRWSTATTWTSWKWANWAVAAAVIGAFAWLGAQTPPVAPTDSPAPAPASTSTSALAARSAGDGAGARPVAAEHLLVSVRDEGLVVLADGRAARRVRAWYLDTVTWREPDTNRSLRWSVPREEVRVVPVAVY